MVDCETTGLDTNTDELIELALVQFWFDRDSFKVVGIPDRYSGLREPGRPIPVEATRIHGLTDRDVRGARLATERVRSLIAGADFLISHNAAFDKPFVRRLFPDVTGKTWLCSLRGIDWNTLGHPSATLQALGADYGLAPGSAHRALDDAQLLLGLLEKATAGDVPLLKVLVEGWTASGLPKVESPPHITNATQRELTENLAALETTSDLVSRHFLFLHTVATAYQARKVEQKYRTLCQDLARRHLAEFETIAPALKQRFNDTLPYVPTFDQLSMVLVEDGRFDEAVAVCQAAIGFGLDKNGAYEGRIERIRRKQGKPVVSDKEPPPCPYCQVRLKKVHTRKTKCPACGKPIYFWRKQDFFPSQYLREDQQKALYTLMDLTRFGVGGVEFKKKHEELKGQFGVEPRTQDVLWGLFQESVRMNASDAASLAYLHDRMAEFRLANGEDPFELRSHARRWELENLRNRGFQAVVVATNGDCCAACAELAGRRLTVADAIKEALLPLGRCATMVDGRPNCRCRYDVPDEPIVIRI